MKYENVIYEVDDRIAKITLNRPEKRNPLSWPLLADLSAALKEAERDKNIRVIILKGAGPCFSAGHDLSETMGDAPLHKGEKTWDEALKSDDRCGVGVSIWDSRAHVQGHIDYILEIWNNWKPIIAQVHSYCLGGASGIALACDLLIVSEDARLGYPPARGMAPGDEIVIYSWHMGLKKAKELSLTGDSLTADEMLDYGVANYVFPNEKLEEETLRIAKRIANIDLELLSLSKRVVNRTFDQMGFTISMQYGAEFDTMGHFLDVQGEFSKMIREKGIKAALEWRDGPFGGIMGRYPPPRKSRKR
ncbi:MAG TPA: enoyl-CoA hydratase-related protein [Desulfatiglandales bacterium]|nr:enoyl-CoA hydratase-related protein [Desulfatiglandales bacterium]